MHFYWVGGVVDNVNGNNYKNIYNNTNNSNPKSKCTPILTHKRLS